ncbi:DUF2637 domain-containing protein [Microbispora amethystogenes]|uniref:DUF2637 domain-containing protein n=1 Tax=Microbispora amethystogenes TaxID=1427754 RepID=A0ABQ4FLH1_9ACTN|nr:DUF2637 domain-containing protein [Microbispora amethystogenes]GIH35642.1 hypothetical protein Mam01_58060 [Microbispora amethystogenes]
MAEPMNGADQRRIETVILSTTITSVVALAFIAGLISYRHLHLLAVRHGESPWTAALLPLSVDGMVLCASMALLADSRRGRRGGVLPWTLLVVGSLASVAANVAVAEPSLIGRAVAAWPAFAMIGGLEMAFRLVRQSVTRRLFPEELTAVSAPVSADGKRGRTLQQEAWQWALQNRRPDGTLPRSIDLARQFHRSPRWARLVKSSGLNGTLI